MNPGRWKFRRILKFMLEVAVDRSWNFGGRVVLTSSAYPWITGGLAALCYLAFLAAPGFAVRVPVRDGQSVNLKLRSIMTTDNVRKGDEIEFEVGEDVLINGHTVIAKGAMARGKVLDVKGAYKPRAKDAEVVFQFLTVRAVDKQDLPLRSRLEKTKKGKGEEIHETSPIPGQISRVVGADKGKEYAVYVDGAFNINASDVIAAAPGVSPTAPVAAQPSNPVATATTPTAPTPPLAGTDMAIAPSSVAFGSTPDGAEIMIDGTLVGNTPSTLRLTPGHHSIEIRMAGYRTWSRIMVVDPESHPSVRATLVKQ